MCVCVRANRTCLHKQLHVLTAINLPRAPTPGSAPQNWFNDDHKAQQNYNYNNKRVQALTLTWTHTYLNIRCKLWSAVIIVAACYFIMPVATYHFAVACNWRRAPRSPRSYVWRPDVAGKWYWARWSKRCCWATRLRHSRLLSAFSTLSSSAVRWHRSRRKMKWTRLYSPTPKRRA